MIRPLDSLVAARYARGDEERGSASVEAILIIPVVLLILFGIFQGVVILQANNVAQAAASTAYNTARLFDGSTEEGTAAGNAALTQAGNILSGTNVSVQRTPETVTVTITGKAATLIPGLPVAISRTVSGPTERWTQ